MMRQLHPRLRAFGLLVVGLLGGCASATGELFEERQASDPSANRGRDAGGVMRMAEAADGGAPDFEQVYPLFRHHCSGSRCHNQEPAPLGLRLANPDMNVAQRDAVARAGRIHQRINDKSDPMPPTGPLDEEVRTELSRWALGAAK